MLPLITETEIKFLEYIKTCYERLEEYRRISENYHEVQSLPPKPNCFPHKLTKEKTGRKQPSPGTFEKQKQHRYESTIQIRAVNYRMF